MLLIRGSTCQQQIAMQASGLWAQGCFCYKAADGTASSHTSQQNRVFHLLWQTIAAVLLCAVDLATDNLTWDEAMLGRP